MNESKLKQAAATLSQHGTKLMRGLSESELRDAEDFAGASFPPDLRALLASFLPTGPNFPNWRALDSELREYFSWPFNGLCFDLEHNGLWLESWGEAPLALKDKVERLRALLGDAPTLIPMFGHRYLPAEPHEEGNPIYSVYQSDIIYYGSNIVAYVDAEFGGASIDWNADFKFVPFWTELIMHNNRAP